MIYDPIQTEKIRVAVKQLEVGSRYHDVNSSHGLRK